MAEEIETTEEDVAPKKGGKLKLIIIILVVLGILGGGGTFAWFKFIAPAIGAGGESDKEKEEEGEKEEPKKPEITSGPMYPLDSFIINLKDAEGRRFLKLTMELELSEENLNAEITAILPKIKDTILTLLSDKTFKDIYTVEGKFKLRDEITARINRFLATGHIRNIYFTEFVIQ